MKKIAVLIPCYNEALSVAAVVADYRRALPQADIYVYDNNSNDGTGNIAKKAGAIVREERRQGKGNVIRTMFREIQADCYIMTDGDDTYPADQAAEMARLVLEEGADMVIGDRLSSTYFLENKRRFHGGGNVAVRSLINTLFKSDVKDIMTGSRAFSHLFVKSFPVLSKGFEIETEMTIHALDKNFNIRTLSVPYQDRQEGSESKLHTVKDGIKVLRTILRLYKDYRPFPFFSALAGILTLLAVIFFMPIFWEYYATGLVPKIPTLIVVCLLEIVAVQLFACGLILQTETEKHKQLFELQLNQIFTEYQKAAQEDQKRP